MVTDNSTASGIPNESVKQKRSKAMDMRFYWIRDGVREKQYHVYWRSGSTNRADYFTKQHHPKHHVAMRPAYLLEPNHDNYYSCLDPPRKRVDEEDETVDKKPAAKENVQDKKKRRNLKLPLHPNSTSLLPKSIGKSPNMDLDLVDTESESGDKILEDKPKP
jgi:hypothetical protein